MTHLTRYLDAEIATQKGSVAKRLADKAAKESFSSRQLRKPKKNGKSQPISKKTRGKEKEPQKEISNPNRDSESNDVEPSNTNDGQDSDVQEAGLDIAELPEPNLANLEKFDPGQLLAFLQKLYPVDDFDGLGSKEMREMLREHILDSQADMDEETDEVNRESVGSGGIAPNKHFREVSKVIARLLAFTFV